MGFRHGSVEKMEKLEVGLVIGYESITNIFER